MKTLTVDASIAAQLRQALSACDLFRALAPETLDLLIERSQTLQLDPDEELVAEGAPSDSFFVVVAGGLDVFRGGSSIAHLGPGMSAGEMGILLDEPRSATLRSRGGTVVVAFAARQVQQMSERLPGFAGAISRALAQRLRDANQRQPLPLWNGDASQPNAQVGDILPVAFLRRHRVLPLDMQGSTLILGFDADPPPQVLSGIQAYLPTLELRPVRVPSSAIDKVLAGIESGQPEGNSAPPPNLDMLLRRMVAEGASDLHLTAGQPPWWRISGQLKVMSDVSALGADSAFRMLEATMDDRARKTFAETNDVDFAYAIPEVSRFRINMFRDHSGICAVIRSIPSKILTFEQLGLPAVIAKLSDNARGLVLVTGPTGSGKSTTLAAMIDAINRTRPVHILTLEDPIEFVHPSKAALVNQREVGRHTQSYHNALKAALREDPDVVLVGELRDIETVQLAIETANTGHLVFATMHTNTAATTVDRIVDMFPSDMHSAVRTSLAESLRGVVCQTLCRKIGGGRIAAIEVLVANPAIGNLIREGKTFQIPSAMQMGRSLGMQSLNEELANLVLARKVEPEEALSRSSDKADLSKRIGR